jgi:hypothetical protein
VPAGTELVVVELGVNDVTGVFATKLDQVMQVLVDKGVPTVLWLTSSTRSPRLGASAAANNEQLVAAAAGRWAGRLAVVDWGAESAGAGNAHWFTSDLIHLTPTGQANLALVIRDAVIAELPPS